MEELTEGGKVGLQRWWRPRMLPDFSRLCYSKASCSSNPSPIPHLNNKGVRLISTMFLIFQAIYMGLEEKIQKHTHQLYREQFLSDPHTEDWLFQKPKEALHGLQFWDQTNWVWILVLNCTNCGPWVSYFLSLTLSFLTYEVGIIGPVVFQMPFGNQ